MKVCLLCNAEITGKYASKFCSSSCAAKYNNVRFPKRSVPKHYCVCGKEINKRTKQCAGCRNKQRVEKTLMYTIGQLKSLYKENFAGVAAKMRGYSKYKYLKSGKPLVCFNCGYSKHVEVCHIKAVASFSDSATMEEVNNLDNLVALCPNCHWEFDHGLLFLNLNPT
jgi:5-methylcytosine-specific restriction endonuclease McrA